MPTRTITAVDLALQFDDDQTDEMEHAIARAVEAVNLVLQREPYGLGAQLLFVDPGEEDDERYRCDACSEWIEDEEPILNEEEGTAKHRECTEGMD